VIHANLVLKEVALVLAPRGSEDLARAEPARQLVGSDTHARRTRVDEDARTRLHLGNQEERLEGCERGAPPSRFRQYLRGW
jgi:hypothetical protein